VFYFLISECLSFQQLQNQPDHPVFGLGVTLGDEECDSGERRRGDTRGVEEFGFLQKPHESIGAAPLIAIANQGMLSLSMTVPFGRR